MDDKPIPPPYGPTEGMLQGLALMQRLSPTRVDAKLLKANKVAPGNEYKVIGALRYLGIIDEAGKPTDKSRMLKTRGPSYQLAIQDILRTAYRDLFDHINLKNATRDQIHNYFITKLGLGVEMSAKATRFFLGLCLLSEMPLSPELSSDKDISSSAKRKVITTKVVKPIRNRQNINKPQKSPERPPFDTYPHVILAITPEMAGMGIGQLTELFRKLNKAIRNSLIEEND